MGSLRIPAANCGLVGLKPGLGRVPAGIGNGDWFAMAENGPLATTVEDARLMLAVLMGHTGIAGPAESPGRANEEPRSTPAPGPAALRIAVSTRSPLPGVTVSRPYADAAREAARVLAGTGAVQTVRRADPPYPLSLGPAVLARWTAGTAQDAEGLDPRLLTRRTRRHAAAGRLAARTPLLHTDHRERLRQRLTPFFERYDVLLTPALARRGPMAGPWHERGWLPNVLVNTRYSPLTPPWNLTGWPALALPFGTLPGGAPCSVQLVALPGGEERLLEVAALLEKVRPWPRTARLPAPPPAPLH